MNTGIALLSVLVFGPVLALAGYGIYCYVKDIREQLLARTCPVLTITWWRVEMHGTNGREIMYHQNDHRVPDAEQRARQIYEKLLARKTESLPFWNTKTSKSEGIIDLSHISEIKISSSSYNVRVLPCGKHRITYG